MKQLVTKGGLTVTDEGVITGIAWPFGSPDSYGDVILKGAFAKAPSQLPMLWSHHDHEPIGIWESIKETARGLEVRGRMLIDQVPLAAEIFALVKSGAVRGLSIGFFPIVAQKNATGGNDISDLRLGEISVVSVPAHEQAGITTIKSAKGRKGNKPMAKAAIKRVRKELEASDEQEVEQIVEEVIEESTLEDRVTALEDRVTAIEETVNGTAETVEEVDKSLKTMMTKMGRPGIIRNVEKPEDIQRKAFTAYLRKGDKAVETKSLRTSIDGRGGYLAPAEFTKELLREIVEFSPVRSVARVGTTGNPSVIIPAAEGEANGGWVGELEESPESDFGYGEKEIPIHELATWIGVPNATLADAEIDIEADIRFRFAEDIGVKESRAFVLGSGVKQPEGFLTRNDIPETVNGHATNLSADALIDLLYAQPQVYRSEGVWVMNGNTLAATHKLKDGQGNYLWQPSYQAGQPETILGRPVLEMVDMPDIGSGAFPILYGDFSGYRIYDRLALDLLVDPYSNAKKRMTNFHVTYRVGGGLVEPKKFRKLKMAAS